MMRASGTLVLRRGQNRRRSLHRQPLWTRARLRIVLTRLAVLLGVVTLMGLIFVYWWQSVEMIQLAGENSAIRAKVDRIKDENEKLEFEVSRLFSVPRIRQLATEKLGMVEADVEELYLPPKIK